MILVTTYKVKPHLTKAELAEMMTVFATVGNTPSTKVHYVNADLGGGIVVNETDDLKEGYANMLHYGQWVEFDTKVMMTVEEAVPLISAFLG